MEQKVSYNLEKYMSLFYLILIIASLFIDLVTFGFLFQIIILPFLLLRLKKYFHYEYSIMHVKFMVNLCAVIVVLSTLLPIVGAGILSALTDISKLINSSDISMLMNSPYKDLIINYSNIMGILLVVRGLAFIALGIQFLWEFNVFNISTKSFTITLLIFGIQTIIAGVFGLYPAVLNIITLTGINIIKYSLPLIQILLLGSLFFMFGKSDKTENGNLIISNDE